MTLQKVKLVITLLLLVPAIMNTNAIVPNFDLKSQPDTKETWGKALLFVLPLALYVEDSCALYMDTLQTIVRLYDLSSTHFSTE